MLSPQLPGFSLTFLYYFSMTAFAAWLVASQALGLELGHPIPFSSGALLGLVAGAIGAYQNRGVTVAIAVKDRKSFERQLTRTLAEIGFTEISREDEITIYSPPQGKAWISGKLYLNWNEKSAVLAARARIIRRLQSLRVS